MKLINILREQLLKEYSEKIIKQLTDKWKKEKLLGFANNEFRILITKTKIASFGMNYQNCHNQIFASLDFSFEGLYQAMRRSYRFGQKHEVNIYLITTDTMSNVKQSINNKQKQFEIMQEQQKSILSISKKWYCCDVLKKLAADICEELVE